MDVHACVCAYVYACACVRTLHHALRACGAGVQRSLTMMLLLMTLDDRLSHFIMFFATAACCKSDVNSCRLLRHALMLQSESES